MSNLKIYPLHVGSFVRPKQTFGFWLEPGTNIEAPLIAWYIAGSDKKILIDTGGPDPEIVPQAAPYWRDEGQSLISELERVGVRPEEIDIVVLTHFHWDHCANIGLFPQAKVIVQETELVSARSPLPLFAKGYIPEIVNSGTFCPVSGDQEIAAGVNLLLTPGHTEGSQGVLVEAESRPYFISGDTFGLFECLKSDPPLVSGIYVDLRKYYESLEKIATLNAFCLPGHDFKVFEQQVYS